MNGFNKFLVAAFMTAAMLLPNMAQAMEIRQFDKMAVPDQSEYVGLLVQGAEKVLTNEGRSDLAAQVEHLFTTTEPGDKFTLGMVEFERNLAILRENDAKISNYNFIDLNASTREPALSLSKRSRIDSARFWGISSVRCWIMPF